MTAQQAIADAPVRQFEYDDRTVYAADVGEMAAQVDVVGDTVIVVTDDDQYELDVPGEDTAAFMKNGVLTVEVSA
ncbi:MAG: DUF7127 family protein [Halococcoides sp.]